MARWPAFTPTRIKPLGLSQIDGNVWRFVDPSDGRHATPAVVGPLYKTQGEALADLDRYAGAGGWVKEPGDSEKPLREGEIVQIDPSHKWGGCLAEVAEIKASGSAMVFVRIPHNDGTPPGDAFIRLLAGEFERVGAVAVWVRDHG